MPGRRSQKIDNRTRGISLIERPSRQTHRRIEHDGLGGRKSRVINRQCGQFDLTRVAAKANHLKRKNSTLFCLMISLTSSSPNPTSFLIS